MNREVWTKVSIFIFVLVSLLSMTVVGFGQPALPFENIILGSLRDADRIILACDTSGSIEEDELEQQKEWIKAIVRRLIDLGRNPEIAVVAFESVLHEIVSPNPLEYIRDGILSAIDGIRTTEGLTYTLGAVRYAIESACPNGALVLSTDGFCNLINPNGEKDEQAAVEATLAAADEFKTYCGRVVAIGMGVESDDAVTFLAKVASPGGFVNTLYKDEYIEINLADVSLQIGAEINDQFTDQGILIEGTDGDVAFIRDDDGIKTLSGSPDAFGGTITLWFIDRPVSEIWVTAGIFNYLESTTLRAFGEDGNLLSSIRNTVSAGLETLYINQPGIVRLVFSVDMEVEDGGAAIRSITAR